MTITSPLQPGDHLRVIAPSTNLRIVSNENRVAATRRLEALGFRISFGRIAALVIGRFQRASGMDRSTLAFLVSRLDLPAGVPVVANVDAGHTDPMATIPIGGRASVEAAPGETTIEVWW